jgi:hypothetical protein
MTRRQPPSQQNNLPHRHVVRSWLRCRADGDIVVDFPPALGFKGARIEVSRHQLRCGLAGVAHRDNFAVTRNPFAAPDGPLVGLVYGIDRYARAGEIFALGSEVLYSGVLGQSCPC